MRSAIKLCSLKFEPPESDDRDIWATLRGALCTRPRTEKSDARDSESRKLIARRGSEEGKRGPSGGDVPDQIQVCPVFPGRSSESNL